jgi:hypothetical protein
LFRSAVKGQEHRSEHSSPSSAKVKNGGAIPPLPHTSSRSGTGITLYRIWRFTQWRLWQVVFWDTTPCCPLKVNRRLGGTSPPSSGFRSTFSVLLKHQQGHVCNKSHMFERGEEFYCSRLGS